MADASRRGKQYRISAFPEVISFLQHLSLSNPGALLVLLCQSDSEQSLAASASSVNLLEKQIRELKLDLPSQNLLG